MHTDLQPSLALDLYDGKADWFARTLSGATFLSVAVWWTAVWFAWLEIEIEGPHAWARANRYTWKVGYNACGQGCGLCGVRTLRRTTPNVPAKSPPVEEGLPLTGYHLTMFTSVLLFHLVGVYGLKSLQNESLKVSDVGFVLLIYALVVALEDAFWYQFNYLHKQCGTPGAFDLHGFRQRLTRYFVVSVVIVFLWFVSHACLAYDLEEDAGVWMLYASVKLGLTAVVLALLIATNHFLLVDVYAKTRNALFKSEGHIDNLDHDSCWHETSQGGMPLMTLSLADSDRTLRYDGV